MGGAEFNRLILSNAVVHTMDDGASVAEAIGFADGRVTAVGTHEAVRHATPGAVERDLDGGAIYPGFIDAHHHLCFAATFAGFPEIRCPPVRRLSHVLDAVAAQAAQVPPGQWIVLGGLDEMQLPERRKPTRDEIDRVAPAHPVLLTHFTYHEGVLNSLGLRGAGFSEAWTDAPGGWLGRTRRGRLDGRVFERCFGRAEAVARGALLAADREGWFARANAYQERVLAAGITHVCDAAVPPNLEALYREWQRRGELHIGVTMMPIADALLADPTSRLDGAATGAREGRLALGALKLFLDGGVHCAMCFSLRDAIGQFATLVGNLLRAPSRVPWRLALQQRGRLHRDGTVRTGLLYYDDAELDHLVAAAGARGFSIGMHAAGNAAVRQALACFGRARRGALPSRIDHFFFADDAMVRHAADEGIVAVVQPAQLAVTGDWILQTGLPRGLAYHGYRQMRDAGVALVGSSDAPVVGFDVLSAIDAAVRRRVRSGATLGAEQGIGVADALRMYTRNAAAALGLAGEIGELRAGARADAVLLSRDPLAVPFDDLNGIRVLATFAGHWEYRSQ
jgi:predicted amidohydrolase YtcJ